MMSAVVRFTPTHVGNTQTANLPIRSLEVHPHTRGEYALAELTGLLMEGSPPHTWGIPNKLGNETPLGRFTPTHVGNTFCRSKGGFAA